MHNYVSSSSEKKDEGIFQVNWKLREKSQLRYRRRKQRRVYARIIS